MIRVVCQETDFNDAAHVGGPVHTAHRTFDIDAPELETWLRRRLDYGARSVLGIELLPPKEGTG